MAELLTVCEVAEAVGTLAGGKPGVNMGGPGLVIVVGGEMANSGFLIFSSCFGLSSQTDFSENPVQDTNGVNSSSACFKNDLLKEISIANFSPY